MTSYAQLNILPGILLLSTLFLKTVARESAGSHVNDSETNRKPYFGDFFYAVYHSYAPIHGYFSLFGCVLGVIANAFNIIVLTRSVA